MNNNNYLASYTQIIIFKDANIMKMIRIMKMNKATLCFLAA